jgi:hypothetical protein
MAAMRILSVARATALCAALLSGLAAAAMCMPSRKSVPQRPIRIGQTIRAQMPQAPVDDKIVAFELVADTTGTVTLPTQCATP